MRVVKGTGGRIRDLAFSPDGRWLASAAGRGRVITLCDLAQGNRKRLRGHPGWVRRLAFAPVGDQLASLDNYGRALLWRRYGDELPTQINVASDSAFPNNLAFAPDGRMLALSCWDGVGGHGALLWDIASERVLHTFGRTTTTTLFTSLAFAPDGQTLASGQVDGTVHLWDVARGNRLATLVQRLKVLNSLSYSPDGRILAVALGLTVALWDVARAAELPPLQGKQAGPVWSVAFTPDGQTLMTGSTDGTVKFWDVATGRERSAFDWGIGRVHVVAFAPDGMRAAAGGDGDIVIWDVDPL